MDRHSKARSKAMKNRLFGQNSKAKAFSIFKLQRRGAAASRPVFRVSAFSGLPLGEFLVFNQELLALVKAGLPVLRVWDLLIERARHQGFQQALRMVRQDIRGGSSASEALAKHPGYFSELYVATIRAGEQSGNLVEVLQRFILYLKLMIGLRQKVAKALAYPAFLILVGVAVVGFLLSYVMPTFISVYAETAKSLPAATQFLIDFVSAAKVYVLPGVVSIVGLLLVGRTYYGTPKGHLVIDQLLLRAPVLGADLHQASHDSTRAHIGNNFSRRHASGRCISHHEERDLQPIHCGGFRRSGRRNP